MKKLWFKIFCYCSKRGVIDWIPDSLYLKIKYYGAMGKTLDFNNPKTFNEKLQWLKINNRQKIMIDMVDKVESKKWFSKKIGEEYIIPTLGVWDRFDDIDFEKLPDKFVLKCTHDSGGVIICKDKKKLDYKTAKKKMEKSLKRNYYYNGREWPYKNIKPRIIAETYMEDKDGVLNDYKFTCYNGKAENVMVCCDRAIGDVKFYFFDKNWELLRLNERGLKAPEGFSLSRPNKLEEMFAIAEKLSEGFPYLRVDLYCIDDKIYFGEVTFYPDSGFDKALLPETDDLFGSKIDLSIAKNEY